jgi:alpha-beta hydrolase superfamily lysophospholipase
MLDSLVETKDGQRIAARFFRPQGEPKGSVLIVPAMGVTQDYYQPFASWLARQGFTAATFDYRGTGLSRPRELRGFKAVPNKDAVKKAVTVATGSGYWRENSPQIRTMAWWLWFVVTPPVRSRFGDTSRARRCAWSAICPKA